MEITWPKKSSEKNKNRLSLKDKLNIIEKVEKGHPRKLIAQEYNIDVSNISRIVKNEENIIQFNKKIQKFSDCNSRKIITNFSNQQVDTALYTWFEQKRMLNEPLSGPILKQQALFFHEKLGGSSRFVASDGWLSAFKKRHGIKYFSIPEKRLPANEEAAIAFKTDIPTFLRKENFSLHNVYNCDETGLFWKKLPNKTLPLKTECTAEDNKLSQERITVLLCCNATGDHKIPLLVIGKYKNPQCFKNLTYLPVSYQAQQHAWMNAEIFLNWYKTTFIAEVKKYQAKTGNRGKTLLLLDNAACHLSVDILDSVEPHDFRVMFFPPDITSSKQPLGEGIIPQFKRIYKRRLLRALLLNESVSSVVDFQKHFTIKDACSMAADAWDDISNENITSCWRNLLTDSTDNSPTEIITPDDILEVCIKIDDLSDVTLGDAESWLNADKEDQELRLLDDDEIMAEATETEEDDNFINDTPSSIAASRAFRTSIEWAEKQPNIDKSDLEALRRIYNIAADMAESEKFSFI